MNLPGRRSNVLRLSFDTQARSQMLEITRDLQRQITQSGVSEGVAVVYVPHTTAGVTIQENADPDVQHDLLAKLDRLIPKTEDFYRHAEGNSDSHLKTVLTGTSATLLVDSGQLVLGRWQGVYLCEFDGPRTREVLVRLIKTGRAESD